MITIVDYGVGNLRSVQRAIQRYYPEVIISNEEEQITKAIGIVLPGVGAFGDAVQELKRKGLFEALPKECVVEELTDYEMNKLNEFKRWIYKSRGGKEKNPVINALKEVFCEGKKINNL